MRGDHLCLQQACPQVLNVSENKGRRFGEMSQKNIVSKSATIYAVGLAQSIEAKSFAMYASIVPAWNTAFSQRLRRPADA